MEYAVYQEASRRTRRKGADKGADMMNALFGIMGETGEIADLVKKLYFHEHKSDAIYPKLAEEAGDLLWYVSWLADEFGLWLEDLIVETTLHPINLGVPALQWIALRLNSNEDRLVQWVEDVAYRGGDVRFVTRGVEVALSQILHHLQWLAVVIGVPLKDIAAANIEKLHRRYPNGFDPRRSINRGQDGS